MRKTQPLAAAGLSLALQAASSATSTSTTPTIQASFAKEPEFFNSLLGQTSQAGLKGDTDQPSLVSHCPRSLGRIYIRILPRSSLTFIYLFHARGTVIQNTLALWPKTPAYRLALSTGMPTI